MAEASQITYDLKEITALMIKDQGIRTGTWMIFTRFNFAATNILSEGTGPSGPGIVAQLVEVGIQKAEAGPLSVDAAAVWADTVPARVARKTAK